MTQEINFYLDTLIYDRLLLEEDTSRAARAAIGYLFRPLADNLILNGRISDGKTEYAMVNLESQFREKIQALKLWEGTTPLPTKVVTSFGLIVKGQTIIIPAVWRNTVIERCTELDLPPPPLFKKLSLAKLNQTPTDLSEKFQPLIRRLIDQGWIFPDGAIEKQIKELALEYATQIQKEWGLKIKPEHTPEAIASKILRRYGRCSLRRSFRTIHGDLRWESEILKPMI